MHQSKVQNTSSHAIGLNSQHGKFPSTSPDALPRPSWCTKFSALLRQVCASLLALKKLKIAPNLLGLLEKNILTFLLLAKFCWLFQIRKKCFDFFLATSHDIFAFFGHFLNLCGLVSPVVCPEIPLCTKNYVTLMCRVRRKPYYAGSTPKFLAQSCCYARHIWHNMYVSQYVLTLHIFTSASYPKQQANNGSCSVWHVTPALFWIINYIFYCS